MSKYFDDDSNSDDNSEFNVKSGTFDDLDNIGGAEQDPS